MNADWAVLGERFARALGVWAVPLIDSTGEFELFRRPMGLTQTWTPGQLRVWERADGLFGVGIGVPGGGRATIWRDVDAATLLVLLLGYARGERVDFGKCKACAPMSGPMAFETSLDAREWSKQNGHGTEVITKSVEGWWGLWLKGLSRFAVWGDLDERPCQACTVDGEPIGRDVRPWERAVLEAMPRDVRPGERATSWGPPRDGYSWPRVDGDPAARDALGVHAHLCSGPEYAAVFGDWRQAYPGRDVSEFKPTPEGLGLLLAAWLRGECEACGGKGKVVEAESFGVEFGTSCKPCNGRGLVLGAHNDDLRERVVRAMRARLAHLVLNGEATDEQREEIKALDAEIDVFDERRHGASMAKLRRVATGALRLGEEIHALTEDSP